MTVKELIEALSKLPQDAEVCYTTIDNGLKVLDSAKAAYPGSDEAKEILGDVFVYLE